MPDGSVRDRVRAAEALQSEDSGQNGSPTSRRGHKLALKTDELIKEEFLRRGDGGWSKSVDIGQKQPFISPPARPFIKVTADTPMASKPPSPFPGKLPKDIPGAFEPAADGSSPTDRKPEASGPTLAGQRSVEKGTLEAEYGNEVPVAKYASLLEYDERPMTIPPMKAGHRSHGSTAPPKPSVEDDLEEAEAASESEEQLSSREKVLFDPDEWDKRRAAKQERREQRRADRLARSEAKGAVEDTSTDQLRNRSPTGKYGFERHSHSHLAVEQHSAHRYRRHSSRSRSRHEGEQAQTSQHDSHRAHRHSSRSRSRHDEKTYPEVETPRRSSHSLWPSFSQTERRSMSDILDTAHLTSISVHIRPRSSHSRTRSDVSDSSTIKKAHTSHTELTPKKLEFAEYLAGKKLDHLPPASPPLRPPPSPMGYVRSRSSTGEHSEFYTKERNLLRKSSEDEIVPRPEHNRGRRERHHSSSRATDKEISEPWQVKLFQGIARMS